MKMKKGVQISNAVSYMIGIFILLVLAFTWFFPTINGSSAINNASTLWLGGVDYNWAVPVLSIVIILALVVMVLKKGGLMGGK